MSGGFTFVALHGLGSSPASRKNEHFAARFEARHVPLVRPDLNQPSFGTLSFEAMIAEVGRAWDAAGRKPLRIVGSSLGGYVAALFAARHPERVDRLILLCPAFDLAGRWKDLVSVERMQQWRETGWLALDDAARNSVPVHYAFFEEGLTMPPMPAVTCETILIHGRRDETVPFDQSLRYTAATPAVRELVAVDDGHDLLASLSVIDAVLDRFFLAENAA